MSLETWLGAGQGRLQARVSPSRKQPTQMLRGGTGSSWFPRALLRLPWGERRLAASLHSCPCLGRAAEAGSRGIVLSPPYRKCKLVTSGPWLEVAPIPLRDVSIIPESPGANGSGHGIALWAASDKGDVLCRLGVSELNPAVSTLSLPLGTTEPAHPAGPPRVLTYSPEIGLLWSRAGLRPPLACPGWSLGLVGTACGLRGHQALGAAGAEDRLV